MDKILSPIKGRVLKYLETSNISRESFYRETGISASNFKGVGLQSELGGDKIAKILTAYPELNSKWLVTGQGEMCSSESSKNQPTAYIPAGENMTANISDITQSCADSTAVRAVPFYEPEPGTGLPGMFGEHRHRRLVCHIAIPGLPPCDGALRIVSDAMYPILKCGDIVLYKEVNDIAAGMLWGEMYLLAFEIDGSEYVVLRYVRQAKDDTRICLESYNTQYSTKEIPASSIRAAALVCASIRYNTIG